MVQTAAQASGILFAGTPEGLAQADTPTAPFPAEELERAASEGGLGLNVREIDLDVLNGGVVGDGEPDEVVEEEPEAEKA